MKRRTQKARPVVDTLPINSNSSVDCLAKVQQEQRSIKEEMKVNQQLSSSFEMTICKNNNSSAVSVSQQDKPPPRHSRSPYHNFQKHTVVLIQKLTKRLCRTLADNGREAMARRMWNIFLSSGTRSKKMITILFGEADLSSDKYRALLIQSYFGELCQEQQQAIRDAQNILRQKVLQQLSDNKVIAQIRRNRHIKYKEKFWAYYSELLAQLREGPLQKFRMSHQSSQKILDSIQTAPNLNEISRK